MSKVDLDSSIEDAIADIMCHVAREASGIVEQWRRFRGALWFPQCFVYGASIAVFQSLGNKENVHLTKTQNFLAIQAAKISLKLVQFIKVVDDKASCWICAQYQSDYCTLPMICADCEKSCSEKGSCNPLEEFALQHYLWKYVHVPNSSMRSQKHVEQAAQWYKPNAQQTVQGGVLYALKWQNLCIAL